MEENDRKVSLLERLYQHARATAAYSVYYGEGRDTFDVRGRTTHESIFNTNDGNFRCPNSQQGYSPFSTWTRGLAWAMVGFSEQLEFLETLKDAEVEPCGGRKGHSGLYAQGSRGDLRFPTSSTRPSTGIPYWDYRCAQSLQTRRLPRTPRRSIQRPRTRR